jgi:hypothetical protein
MEEKNKDSKENLSDTFSKLKAIGAKHVQKTGAILMPISKQQKESIEKKKKPE